MGINKFLGFIWTLIAVILLFILISGIRGRKFHFFNFGKSFTVEQGALYSTDIFDADNIESVKIDLVSEALVIKGHNENVIKVELYCNEATAPSVDEENSVLRIQSQKKVVNVGMMNRKVIVYIPYNKNFTKANISLVSGSMHIDDLVCDKFDSNTVSGSTHFENCTFDEMSLHQTSGSLHIDQTITKALAVDCTSGSIHINLKNPLTKDSSITSTSGSIRFNIPKNSNLKIDYKSNGSYRNSFTGTSGKSGTEIMGSGDVNLFIKATSGSIHID